MSYEENIDFLVKKRQRFKFVLWTTNKINWQAADKRVWQIRYSAAQVTDSLSIWLYDTATLMQRNKGQGYYEGWPIEIRKTLNQTKAGVDYLGITREVIGVASN